jgi:hypothetical protein
VTPVPLVRVNPPPHPRPPSRDGRLCRLCEGTKGIRKRGQSRRGVVGGELWERGHAADKLRQYLYSCTSKASKAEV